MEEFRILVVDDEASMRESLSAWLREDGFPVDTAENGASALRLAKENDYAICFVDLKMPGGMNGIEVLREVRKIRPDASIVIITAYATVDTAVEAMKEGANDYIVKPFNPEEITLIVNRIVEVKTLRRENLILRKRLARKYEFRDIISKNPRMHDIFDLIHKVSALKSTVLVTGDSGTGKELVARAIHYAGNRGNSPFVHVSCAALAETLLESELFGHEKGSFTGAVSRKIGKFEQADGGTLFLDEIGDIPPKLQLDLLRVLQERSFCRVGGAEEIRVDVRIIAATNRDLEGAVREGQFREDLYYRLNVVNIHVPPLRERREDIPLLARHFINRLNVELGLDVRDITEDALRVLMDYDWPGNVRELENAVERAMVSVSGHLLDLPVFDFVRDAHGRKEWSVPTDKSLAEIEREVIPAVLARTGGNIKEAASILGIDRSTLYEKIRRYGVRVPGRSRA
jgi:DNA-binding NtrC family response regulator